jgi:hypothetical protein
MSPAGAHDVDEHFRTAPFESNIPVLLGLTGVWNTTFLGYSSLAILPYTQALSKLAPHIQQARLQVHQVQFKVQSHAQLQSCGAVRITMSMHASPSRSCCHHAAIRVCALRGLI